MATKVFISYSHDDEPHRQRVRALADELNKSGIDTTIDQYVEDSPPSEGWPRWMRKQLMSADFVVLVCTENYHRRFMDEEAAGKGLGVAWESAIIQVKLYAEKAHNDTFLPVLVNAADTKFIPDILSFTTHYKPWTPEGYELLLRRLTEQPRVTKPSLGAPPKLPGHPAAPLFSPKPSTSSAHVTTPSVGPSTIPALSSTFVPRKAITTQIHTALNSGSHSGAIRQVAARAFGGYGKTIAAILYADEYADHYPGGRFFLSTENTDFAVQLASLGRFFTVPLDAKPEEAAAAVKGALEHATLPDGSPAPSLLILDNIVDSTHWNSIVAGGLIPRNHCRVLITSRAEFIPQTTIVRVDALTPEEAREIYARFCRMADVPAGGGRELPDNPTADAITALVGGLAVAVAAIAAYMKLKPDLSWDRYRSTLEHLLVEDLPDAMSDVRAELGTNGRAIEEHRRSLRVIDDALNALTPSELRAVEYSSLLSQDMIPRAWIEWLITSDTSRSKHLEDGTEDPLVISFIADPGDPRPTGSLVVSHLERLGVIIPSSETGQLFSLHRLWWCRTRERLANSGLHLSNLTAHLAECAVHRRKVLVGADHEGRDDDINWPKAITDQSLRAEIVPLVVLADWLWSIPLPRIAVHLSFWLAPLLMTLGRMKEARRCLAPILLHESIVKEEIGVRGLSSCISNFALIEKSDGNHEQARVHLLKAIKLDEASPSPDDKNVSCNLNNLAGILEKLGEYQEGLEYSELSIQLLEQNGSSETLELAAALNTRATLQIALDDTGSAKSSLIRALQIESRLLPADHPSVAMSYYNMGHVYSKELDFVKACAYFYRALNILRRHFDESHSHVQLVTQAILDAGGRA